MGDLVRYLRDHAGQVAGLTLEHVTMVVLAVVVAVVLGVPLGIAATRWRRWERVVMGTTNVLQTVPSLALFGFLIPVPFIGGIGAKTAIVALTLYALLPIVRGTHAGIRGVEPAVREAGLGLGMTGGQLLRRVELPLAAPVILSGVRVATVISVGIATIAAAIGAGGLGVYIFQGLAMVNDTVILAGAVPAALLALAADALLGLLERRITPAGHADRRVERRPA